MKVLVTEELSIQGIALLREHFEVIEDLKMGPAELRGALVEVDAVIVRSKTRLDAAALESTSRLKVIGRAGVGYDNIDLEAASRKGILVMNVPDGSTIAACEHTFALLLSLMRRIPDAVIGMRDGKWRRDLIGNELFGKTLGVVGLGKIGAEVARRARAFGMRVVGHDPFLPAERLEALEVQPLPLQELLETADVITLHVPATESTRKMIGRLELEKMKPTSVIINCARGALIDEEALFEALEAKKIGGAAVDVYTTEPPAFGSGLLARSLPNLLTTPHLGASTAEAQEKVALVIAQQVTRALIDQDFLNSVNMPRISPESLEAVRPTMQLSERLATFLVQWARRLPGEVELSLEGDAAKLSGEYILLGAQKGLLRSIVESPVTFVNAPILAKEQGLKVAQVRRDSSGPYRSAVRLSVGTHPPSVVVGLVGAGGPRLVQIGDFHLDFPLDGRFLLIEHQDQPGAVGRVGTILGNSRINIGRMEVCRQIQGASAMMILTVDSEIPERVMDNLRELEDVSKATTILV